MRDLRMRWKPQASKPSQSTVLAFLFSQFVVVWLLLVALTDVGWDGAALISAGGALGTLTGRMILGRLRRF
jgi:uncharacterized membrane protein YfcA